MFKLNTVQTAPPYSKPTSSMTTFSTVAHPKKGQFLHKKKQ